MDGKAQAGADIEDHLAQDDSVGGKSSVRHRAI